MSFQKYIYVKKQQLSRYLATRFSRSRTYTALQLLINTLKANKHLPERLIALEVFGFIGTSTAMDYSNQTEYLEMWEIDGYYAWQAQKLNPKAKVICGDSVEAVKNGKVLRRDYNLIVIDSNIASALNDGSYESFGVFENSLGYVADKAVVVVTIYYNLNNYAALYGISASQLDQKWIEARKQFYGIDNVVDSPGIDHMKAFEKIIEANNFSLKHSQFLARNDSVGFGAFVIERKA